MMGGNSNFCVRTVTVRLRGTGEKIVHDRAPRAPLKTKAFFTVRTACAPQRLSARTLSPLLKRACAACGPCGQHSNRGVEKNLP
jgi:hypothetical protein